MICHLCPRDCGAERTETKAGGVCAMPTGPVLARAMLHSWEEPCLVGEKGAGAVFFSGCTLGCVFCQNRPISRENFGKTLTPDELYAVFGRLAGQGASCIELVTPTQFTHTLSRVLGRPVPGNLPVVWNSGGYERADILKTLEGKVDVYLPDLKYLTPALAEKYSDAKDYPSAAKAAILEMFRQRGRSFRIRVGEPIPAEELASCGSLREQTEYVRTKTYLLGKELDSHAEER